MFHQTLGTNHEGHEDCKCTWPNLSRPNDSDLLASSQNGVWNIFPVKMLFPIPIDGFLATDSIAAFQHP